MPSQRSTVRPRAARPLSRAGLVAAMVLAAVLVVAASGPALAVPPLGLTRVALAQHDVRLVLRVTTSGPWTAADLAATPGRSVCITLASAERGIPRGRICVTRRERRPALSYTPLAADGTDQATRRLAAVVSRPRPTVLEATFLPVAAGLSVGAFSWWAQTTWIDEAGCATACIDRLPDEGVVPARLALVGLPRCFGAAARDPVRPCANPDLRLTVEPSLARAREILAPYCDARERVGLLSACGFGAAPQDAAGTFALIGDSHAASLKTALEVVTLARRWRGVSIVRAGCPATRATAPDLPTPERSRQCVTWNRQVLGWLRGHRAVDTVFLSAHAGATVAPAAGQAAGDAVRAGYRDEITALLGTVGRVVVIRDTPSSAPGHLGCVARALRVGLRPGPACAMPRAVALRPDPLVQAAQSVRSARVTVIDLTSHVCDRDRCYPVVGGALVQRDVSHRTPAFSASLGPYILRALDAAG